MSIDWITVVAQLLNFAVLVWLLKRFLYRPILDGIDARERELAERVAAADAAKVAAEASVAKHKAALEAFEAEKSRLLQTARDEAEALLDERRQEADRVHEAELATWRRKAAAERERFADALAASGAEALLGVAGKALRDLAGDDLEARIADRFADRIAGSAEALRASGGHGAEARFTTRQELPQRVRNRLEAAFREAVSDAPVSFGTDSEQAVGIVLEYGAARIDWTLDSYLNGMSRMLAQDVDGRGAKGPSE